MKALFILYYFFPENNPGAIQNHRLICALSKKISLDILCSSSGYNTNFTNSNMFVVNPAKINFLYRFFRQFIPDLFLLPDAERFMWLPKIKRFSKKIDIGKYSWVHTISFPYSSHLFGKYLKKKYNLFWVAHFYDPLLDSNYRKFRISLFNYFDRKIEKTIAKHADIIILTNKNLLEIWEKRYGNIVKDKLFILPQCTDPKIKTMQELSLKKGRIVNFIHTGNFYGERTLTDLINALVLLKDLDFSLNTLVKFTLIGKISDFEINNIFKHGLNDIFDIIGYVPYNELQSYIMKSDVLLLIDAPSDVNMFFPSKLTEYLSYNKPILGLTPEKSISSCIINEAGHTAIDNKNIKGIAEQINYFINNFESKLNFDSSFYKKYLPDVVANNYIDIIDSKKNLFNEYENTN